jgi:nucleoside-diphosphate-sugar epimerase
MRVLVTGSDGYIGCLLPPLLVEAGLEVVGVDTGFYRLQPLYDGLRLGRPPTIEEDIRRLRPDHFTGFDAVVHMAELSNDRLAELEPRTTYEVNHRGSLHVARLAKAAGLERFVYTSSCSVYGIAEEDVVDEESPVRPQTAYADCKVLVEQGLSQMADEDFSPTILRNATAYGASPRLRFDVVLNNLCGLAWTTGVIAMDSDGTPWRPLVHALDICRAIVITLEAPRERVHNQILNVGPPGANFRVGEIAEIVAGVFPGCRLSVGSRSPDTRSYRVSFEKIRSVLPAFRCEWDPRKGAAQLRQILETVGLTEEDFRSRRFTRLRQLEHLLSNGQLDRDLFWRGEHAA